MANLHILLRDPAGSDIAAVAHVAVPVGTNSAGVSWQTAVVRSGKGGTTVLPDGDGTAGTIAAAEKASIVAGSLIEVPLTLRPQSILTGGQTAINAYLDAQFSAVSTDALARLQIQLQFYGATR